MDGYNFYNACREGRRDIIMNYKGVNDWNPGMRGACRGGHIDLVGLMISKGATDWDGGLHEACLAGNIDLAELMISKGAYDWSWGLSGACKGGHRDLVELMIFKGAKKWDEGLYWACFTGHRDIVLFLLVKGADWNRCTISLKEDEIDWLCKAGVKVFPKKYDQLVETCRQKQQYCMSMFIGELNIVRDVANILVQY